MFGPLIEWFGTLVGKLCVGGGILAAILGLWFGWLHSHDKKVVAGVIENSKVEGKKINAKNDVVRDRADKPGAADRVRAKFCRDC